MKKSLKIFLLSLLFIFSLSFQFIERFSHALPGDEDKLAKSQSTGSITIDAFTSDDSSKVVKYIATLMDANNNVIKTAYPDSNRVLFKDLPTPVENERNAIPSDFRLYQNYPNPFNPSTKIQFDISKYGSVRLDVYDILGKHVKTLVNGELNPGKYEAEWAGDNENGGSVAAGVYIYRLIAGDKSVSRKMIDLGSGGGKSAFRQLGKSGLQNIENTLSKTANMQYKVEIAPTDSTNPKILAKTINVDLAADTAFNAYLDRKPVAITANVFTDNGATNVTGYNAILKDTLDKVIEQVAATGNQVIFQNKPANKFYRMQIQNTASTNPSIKDTVFQFKAISDTLFNVNAQKYIPKRTISGILTDDEGNVKAGYILAYNAKGDSAVAMAGADGKFTLTTKASNGDTIKAQIYNPNHAEGFIRKLYVAGKNDTSNVKIDAVPLLADSSYIGPDTLASFAWEGNFQPLDQEFYEGLKKADLNNMKEVISSIVDYGDHVDTIKADEQVYLKQVIGQDTVYNNVAIVQEGLSARVAPGEVGFTSTIGAGQTVLHKNTGRKTLQPADIWLVKIAENYAPKTSYYALLTVGSLKPVYDRLKNLEGR